MSAPGQAQREHGASQPQCAAGSRNAGDGQARQLLRQLSASSGLRFALAGSLAAIGLLVSSISHADSGRQMPRIVPAAYGQECASCHVAYPPGLLPAGSWKRLMGGLDRHFGTDASLDAQQTQTLALWLQRHAGTYKRVWEEPPQDRITRSAWFERKHREIDASVWRLPSVKTAANCGACHASADRGDFDDDHLKLPAGVPSRLRHPWDD